MPTIILKINATEPIWPELQNKDKKIYHLGENAPPIEIGALPKGMTSGKTAIALKIDIGDNEHVVAETSLSVFLQAADMLRSAYPNG